MHSQNCSYLQSKKQPPFHNSLPHNIELLRNFSSKAFSNIDSSTRSSVHITSPNENMNPNEQSRTGSIMDIVYRFSDSSRIKHRQTASNIEIATEKSRPSCKHLISNYNTVTQMPLLSSHLVGGFVGSKSQLGRRPTHGFGISMWDIISELVDIVGNSSGNSAKKGNIRKNSILNKKCPSEVKVSSQENCLTMIKNSSSNNRSVKLKEANNCQKQSYADVTKIKLDPPEMTIIEIASGIDDHDKSLKICNSKPVFEHTSLCDDNDNRSRISSECSIDSEDSFIVFEYCEGDDISVDSDSTSSDDDSLVDFQIIKERSDKDGYASPKGKSLSPQQTDEDESHPVTSYLPPKGKSLLPQRPSTSKEATASTGAALEEVTALLRLISCEEKNPSFAEKQKKRVRFAEGKDLVKVHRLVKWASAGRMARTGPWEMHARDRMRFHGRISNLEPTLSSVLDPAHRRAIFDQRFGQFQ